MNYQQIFDASADALFIHAPDGRILDVNQAMCSMFGYDAGTIARLSIDDVSEGVSPYSAREAQEYLRQAIAHGSATFDWHSRHHDGHLFWTEVALRRCLLDGQLRVVASVRDITVHRKTEEALAAKLADIERFNKLAVDREQRISDLKQRINALELTAGMPPSFANPSDASPQIMPSRATIEPTLGELVDRKQMQLLFDSYCDAIGVASAIIDLNGVVFVAARWQRACTDFHRRNPEACARCIESDVVLAHPQRDGESCTIYTCRNGLTDAAAPIVINGKHVANVFIGQFFLTDPDLAFFRRQAQQFGFDEDDYMAAIAEVPLIDRARIPAILQFMTHCANTIAVLGIDRLEVIARSDELRRQQLAAMSLAEDATQAQHAVEATQQSLLLSEERLQIATRAATIAIWDWDIQRDNLLWDDRMFEIYGFRPGAVEVSYDLWRSCLHPDDKERVMREINAALLGEREYALVFRIVRPNGEVRHVQTASHTFRDASGEPVRMTGTHMDITERKLAEEELERYRNHLEELVSQRTRELTLLNQLVYGSLESAAVGAWWIDFNEPDTFHALDTTGRMIGQTPYRDEDKAYRISDWLRILQEGRTRLPQFAHIIDETLAHFEAVVAGRAERYRALYPVVMANGYIKWIDARADVPMRDAQGRALIMTGTLIDITQLKQAEQSLQLILDSLPDAVFIHDPDGKIVTVNRKVAEMYQLADPMEAESQTLQQFILPVAAVGAPWPADHPPFESVAMIPASGQQFPVEVNLRQISYRGAERILATVRDISERKRAEEEMRRYLEELATLNKAMTGRELRIIELKVRINAQCQQLGEPLAYPPVWDGGLIPDPPPHSNGS